MNVWQTFTAGVSTELQKLLDWLSLEGGAMLFLDILIVTILIYWLYTLIRGTRATRILAGLIAVEVVMLIARFSGLQILAWFMSKTFLGLLIAIPVIFQPELRRALGKIGEGGMRNPLNRGRYPSYSTITEVVRACESMAEERVGGLILIKRRSGLDSVVESGTALGARVTSRLLRTIFAPLSELHDGAVVIEHDRIVAAGCFYVSALSDTAAQRWGARHRAAVGFSLESDALVISISQERGTISLAHDGKVVEKVTAEELEETLGRLAEAKFLPARRGARKKRTQTRAGLH